MSFITGIKEKAKERVSSTSEGFTSGLKAWAISKPTAKLRTVKKLTKKEKKEQKKTGVSPRRGLGTDMFSSRIFLKGKSPKNDIMDVEGGIF